MSDSAHLLIPFASSREPGCREALSGLSLPRLEQLLARLVPGESDSETETSLSLPHERVLARACGLAPADGRIAWAAWQVKQGGGDPGGAAWARITPCHWRVGSDHVAMDDPAGLALDEPESRALLAAVRPFFEEDGIALDYSAPTLWLARGEIFRDFPAASLDRVIGRKVDDWLPRVAGAGPVRRLQQEVQMLLYTSEANDQRQQRGLPPVNSFWVSGTGALPAGATALPQSLTVADALRGPALAGDWAAWAAAWREIDAREGAALLQSLSSGRPVTLTLAGERSARSWTSAGGGWLRRLGGMFGGARAAVELEAL
ncbi:phosphoglycerate mutase [Ramlibacter sp. RBP-2]|uniref:Phosphoglycerate mutase n=1 Tax=Ramlibacter lithotrophicus TaxID=2606681 RepID=A0A7X6DKF6_9BURK|nr:phosphoglycerate mutase [Ramlibacter lithotrophicus]NKE68821.1 phosphoglycerate mutase [Ramlibacter lithotrophicus]